MKIPPVVQFLFAAAFMLIVAEMEDTGSFDWAWRIQLSVVIAIVGVLLILIGGKAFIEAKTTVNPLQPNNASALVTSGIYRFSRNPMYLGMSLLLLAWVLYLGSGLSFIMLPLFCWCLTKTQIYSEEVALENKFGKHYRAYKSKVRRWI